MAHGIQHVQAAQFFELPSSSARGVPELRNKKCLNPNLTCGTRIWGQFITYEEKKAMFKRLLKEIDPSLPVSELTPGHVSGLYHKTEIGTVRLCSKQR